MDEYFYSNWDGINKNLPTCRRAVNWGVAFSGVLLICGMLSCGSLSSSLSTDQHVTGSTSLRLPNTAMDIAFDSSLYAVKQLFPIATASRQEGKIISNQVEYEQAGGTGRLRDNALQFKNRMRRKATLWISESDSGTIARCQVLVQRLDTADHRIFQQQQQFNDLPNTTPIERDAATTANQNQAWTNMSRDRQLERQLLQILFSRATGADGKT